MVSRTSSISLALVAHASGAASEGKFVDGMDIDGIEEETPMDEGTPEPEDDRDKTRAVRFINSARDGPEPETKDDQPDEEQLESAVPKLGIDTRIDGNVVSTEANDGS